MKVTSDLAKVRRVIRRRGAYRQMVRAAARRPRVPEGHARVVLYFADSAVNLYQVRQWLEPLRRLAEQHPVVVVTRSPDATLALFDESPFPVLPISTIAGLERWLATQQVATFFYVNQNRRNFAVMRFADQAHVFLSHGESDKAYMASNQLKAYDRVFVAGPAAVRRIGANVFDLPADRLVPVGRPQVDVEHAGPALPDDGRTVVLYAPTWEGDRPSMAYSSLVSHGAAMLAALVDDGRFRVVYRPHPRTGAFDPAFARADRALGALLEQANRHDPSAGHVVDRDTDFGWHVRAADVCVTDVSAVAFDWLASGRPLLLAQPASPEAVIAPGSLADRIETLDAADAPHVVTRIEKELAGESAGRAQIVEDYFGDTTPGAAMARFLAAADQVVRERAQALLARAEGVDDYDRRAPNAGWTGDDRGVTSQ
ncbi:CDP-glycerol glycerophosphotransferase family protein [Cellulomonas sp. PhB150]|uniref:CDP-glycerol glycerophosphotransferase family protein n=1 Tax=Cellulomonas sp. PhB150 TaxID=2485188 RepID=UPI001F2C49A0|nr:CDP-glycerol glycerophosphotransferase family protein [Cellulomonas sp. PhB150]